MVEALAELLATLHESGRVHRDLKPANVLLLNSSMLWRLLDMGIVAGIGAPRGAVLCLACSHADCAHALTPGSAFMQRAASLLRSHGLPSIPSLTTRRKRTCAGCVLHVQLMHENPAGHPAHLK